MLLGIVYVAAGGASGAVLRYLTGLFAFRIVGQSDLFNGTVISNILASFAAGFLLPLIFTTFQGGTPFILFFSVGFLGSWSTFSSFALESLLLIREGKYDKLIRYLAIQIGVVFLAVIAGYTLSMKLYS